MRFSLQTLVSNNTNRGLKSLPKRNRNMKEELVKGTKTLETNKIYLYTVE